MAKGIPDGALNPISPNPAKSKISNRLPNSFFGQMKKSLKESMETNVFDNTGPYRGIVLRVDKPQGLSAPDDYLFRFFADIKAQVPPTVTVKVRIPEIHAHLPIPDEFGSDDGPHQAVINMYPSFTFSGADVAPVSPEDIVIVDFIDKKNMKGGIIVTMDASTVSPGLVCSPREGFGGTPELKAQSPQGDQLGSSSTASPSPKISNIDPETGNRHSDRIFIEQDYPFKVPYSAPAATGQTGNGYSGTQPNFNSTVMTEDKAGSIATNIKNAIGRNVEVRENSKSMIIYAGSLGNSKFIQTPLAAIRRARKAGVDTVFIEALWQGPPEGDISSPEQKTYAYSILSEYARAFSKAGISIFLWGRANKKMSRSFVGYMFRLAKRIGALGVVVNPDASYAIQVANDEHILSARILSELVKSKAREYKMLAGVYLPWFMKEDRIKNPATNQLSSLLPITYQTNFPYEVFYGFDIYLIDAKWNDQYGQFGASIASGLSLLAIDPNTGQAYDQPLDLDEMDPKTIEEVSKEYKNMLIGDNNYIYDEPGQSDPILSLHKRLYEGELLYENTALPITISRNYIPVFSISGNNFYDQSSGAYCATSGVKTPTFFKNELNKFFEENNTGISKIKSFCISSWSSVGEHMASFVGTRWNVVSNMEVPQANLDFSTASNNNEDPDKYLYIDPNGGNSVIDMVKAGIEMFNDTVNPALLLKPEKAPSPESDRNKLPSSTPAQAQKSCPTFNDTSFGTPYNPTCAAGPNSTQGQQGGPNSNNISGAPNSSASAAANSSPGGGYGGGSSQNAKATPPSNGMPVIDCNPAGAVGSVGGSNAAGKALSSGGSPAGGGSAGQAPAGPGQAGNDPFGVNPGSNSAVGNGNVVADTGNNIFDMSQQNRDFSNLGWSSEPGVEMNDSVVEYMNQLSENVYRSLPKSSAAFSSGRSLYSKLRIVNGAMSIEKMIYLMFDKIVAKSSSGRINTMVYDAVYKKSWQQIIKNEVFMSGLRDGLSHSTIRANAVARYKIMLAGKTVAPSGHITGKSVDIHTDSVHAAMNEPNAQNMPPNQMKNTRYVQTLKAAANSLGNTEVCVEDYPQHIHTKTN
tara:strand:+ start:28122 stop:31385 length:3264 start_codon:yes stop_codon:yes gene_type:complete